MEFLFELQTFSAGTFYVVAESYNAACDKLKVLIEASWYFEDDLNVLQAKKLAYIENVGAGILKKFNDKL